MKMQNLNEIHPKPLTNVCVMKNRLQKLTMPLQREVMEEGSIG